MSSKRNSILLIIAAFIWGTTFVAQREGGDALGPFTFTCIRSFIGTLVLIPVFLTLDKINPNNNRPRNKAERRQLLIGGICCGVVLSIASNLQQVGMYLGTSAGKSGFLTTCYIILVPILGIFLKKKCHWNIWIGVVLTVIGLYLLCIKESFSLQFSDILVLFCALMFSIHILVIDHFSPLVDGVRMSCIQFLVCGIITFFPAMFTEMRVAPSISTWAMPLTNINTWIALLYAGVLSSGIAFTLQIIGQKNVNPTTASLLMCLESVFAVLAGWLVLHEQMSHKEVLGCILIFIAVILAQIPVQKLGKKQPDPV